jgi:hypothetical protein
MRRDYLPAVNPDRDPRSMPVICGPVVVFEELLRD